MSELTPITRIESYLDTIVNSGTPPLEDITRIETFLQAIYDNQVCALTPITRIEMFLGKISGQNIVLPEPITRIELYLAAIAGEDVELPENPITRLEMYLADWADSGDWTTISGAIVEFITQRAHKLKSCVVSLSPQQDLHGYDSPWPPGGGKNKLQVTTITQTVNGVTFTVHDDGTITTNGTADGTIYFDLGGTLDFASATYVLSGCPTGGDGSTFHMYVLPSYSSDVGNGIEFTSAVTGVRILVNSGVNMDGKTFKPMLCLASDSQPRVFAPYSNICPISGWTGCEVYDTGHNVWDEEWEVGAYNDETGGLWNKDDRIRSKSDDYIPVKENATYYSYCSTTIKFLCYDKDKNYLGYTFASANSTFTTLANTCYMRFFVYPQYGTIYNDDISINYPDTDHDYHAYNGNSYSVTWEDEVFGGDYNFINGKGNGNRNNAVFDGTEYFAVYGDIYVCAKTFPKGTGNYSNFLCSHTPVASYVNYANASKNTFQFPSSYFGVSTVEEFKAFLAEQNANGTPVTINYPLDTSTEFETTPTPITALKGYNAMWSNAGDIEVTVHGTPVEVETLQALNMLLGGAYHNNHTPEDVSDEEALDIILGGEQR